MNEEKNQGLGYICIETINNIRTTVKLDLMSKGRVPKSTVVQLRDYAKEDAATHRAMDYWATRLLKR